MRTGEVDRHFATVDRYCNLHIQGFVEVDAVIVEKRLSGVGAVRYIRNHRTSSLLGLVTNTID